MVFDLDEDGHREPDSDDDEPQPAPQQRKSRAAPVAAAEWSIKKPVSDVRQQFTQGSKEQRLKGTARDAVLAGDELAIWDLFMPVSAVDAMVASTNVYVEQVKASTERPPWVAEGAAWPPKWTGHWQPVTRQEMYVFMGMCYFQGIYSLPDIDSWWRDEFPCPGVFREFMSRDRYRYIKSALHFADDRVKPANAGPLYKVDSLLPPFLNRCRSIYQLGEHVSADECVIKMESKMAPRSTMYGQLPKPIGQGMVIDVLCEAGDDKGAKIGYLSDGIVRVKGEPQRGRWLLLAGRQVGNWRTWFLDRLSTNEKLAVALLGDHKTYIVGTTRNQKAGKQHGGVEKEELKERGNWTWSARSLSKETGCSTDSLVVCKWFDVKENCLFMSTGRKPVDGQVLRRVAGSEKKTFSAPSVSTSNPFPATPPPP